MLKSVIAVAVACLSVFALDLAQPFAGTGGQRFRLTFNTKAFGPIDVVVRFAADGRGVVGRSSSEVAPTLREMAIVPWMGQETVLLQLSAKTDRLLEGTIDAPNLSGQIRLVMSPKGITGEVTDGPLAGAVSGVPWEFARPLRDYPALVKAMDAVMAQALFDPNQLRNPKFVRFRNLLGRVAQHAVDDADVVFAVSAGWDNQVFSHFGLQRVSRSEIVADTDARGRPAVEVHRRGAVAIMRVNTFLGELAAKQFDVAFADLARAPPTALIVDMRATPGGSLSVRALINRLVRTQDVLGWFVANAWWRSNAALPTPTRLASEPLDNFDDPQAAVERLNTIGLLKVAIGGAPDSYAGPVFVLIDKRTESVAELAAAALQGLGRATVIGERSAGEVLSADTIPLSDGFSLYLPLADYYDARLGRLEGKGVVPDITVPSAQALDRALRLAVGPQ